MTNTQYGPTKSTPTDIKARHEAYQRMLAAERRKVAEKYGKEGR